jgi:hemolysin D
VPAQVSSVGTEPTILPTAEAVPGTVKVELDVQPPADPRILLQHGMTATVEIEVARVSPVALLMRAIGEWNYAAPAAPPPGSPEPAAADAHAQSDSVALAPAR